MKLRDSGMPIESSWEKFFDPDEVLHRLNCGGNVVDAVDFGCGYGTFSIPAAKRIQGLLHAFDIDPAILERLRERACAVGLTNLRIKQRDLSCDGSGLPDASVDYVMLFNILHGEEPVRLLRECARIMRGGGQVGVLHWRSDIPTPRGPILSIRPRPEQIQQWAQEARLESAECVHNIGEFHYGMILKKRKA